MELLQLMGNHTWAADHSLCPPQSCVLTVIQLDLYTGAQSVAEITAGVLLFSER